MRVFIRPCVWLLALLFCASFMSVFEALFGWFQPGQTSLIYQRAGFLSLLQNHVLLVLISGSIGTAMAVSAGILVTRGWGRDFLPLASQVASIGQTFPPVAVLALAVPVLGFGEAPTLMALVLYGLLPILRNTLVGLDGIAPAVKEAASGMGMSPTQVLLKVELPLAGRVILAGVRTSVTINIATAAIGSTIGARTLGDPVIAGLVNGNTGYVLQGALLIGLLAITTDSLFEALQRTWSQRLLAAAVAG
ncbi:ABC transporter permease [Marinobacter caseinilyticus]|uniref:ABC transporter permease n=1 Tax=Marinobacter caseinilyticus TaxID=2692195 RepID=UPI00140DFCD8|nr:ABC transporter permease [Marinobacter caseinilyticus]